MSDSYGSDDTPSVIGFRLTERQVKDVKRICVERDINLREWYAEAFGSFAQERERYADGKEDGEFIYRARPKEGEEVTVNVPEEQLDALRKWAEKDNKSFIDAYYTAVVNHLKRQREKLL